MGRLSRRYVLKGSGAIAATVFASPLRAQAPVPEPVTPAGTPTVRVSVDVLDAHLLEAEEMLAVKLDIARRDRFAPQAHEP